MSADDCLYMDSDGVCCELYLGGSQMAATLSNKGRRLSSALGGASSPSERAENAVQLDLAGRASKVDCLQPCFPV